MKVDELLDSAASASDPSPGRKLYWRNWDAFYDYLYVLGSGDRANPLPDKLKLVQAGERFQLYRISREAPA